jgi:hypothetical protein
VKGRWDRTALFRLLFVGLWLLMYAESTTDEPGR